MPEPRDTKSECLWNSLPHETGGRRCAEDGERERGSFPSHTIPEPGDTESECLWNSLPHDMGEDMLRVDKVERGKLISLTQCQNQEALKEWFHTGGSEPRILELLRDHEAFLQDCKVQEASLEIQKEFISEMHRIIRVGRDPVDHLVQPPSCSRRSSSCGDPGLEFPEGILFCTHFNLSTWKIRQVSRQKGMLKKIYSILGKYE